MKRHNSVLIDSSSIPDSLKPSGGDSRWKSVRKKLLEEPLTNSERMSLLHGVFPMTSNRSMYSEEILVDMIIVFLSFANGWRNKCHITALDNDSSPPLYMDDMLGEKALAILTDRYLKRMRRHVSGVKTIQQYHWIALGLKYPNLIVAFVEFFGTSEKGFNTNSDNTKDSHRRREIQRTFICDLAELLFNPELLTTPGFNNKSSKIHRLRLKIIPTIISMGLLDKLIASIGFENMSFYADRIVDLVASPVRRPRQDYEEYISPERRLYLSLSGGKSNSNTLAALTLAAFAKHGSEMV